jgi:hypothetical protein
MLFTDRSLGLMMMTLSGEKVAPTDFKGNLYQQGIHALTSSWGKATEKDRR